MKKLGRSNEFTKTSESKLGFCMVLANVKESRMQCDDNRSNTGFNG